MIERKVIETVNKYNLIKENESIIAAISGGADSVALLLCLNDLKKELKIKKLVGAHLNHGLRNTAKRDEEFAKKLCLSLGIEFYSEKADIEDIKSSLKVCEEEAGRIARYDFLNRLMLNLKFDKIATAHNLNDQSETFFMRVLRGSSLDGLSCIKPIREDGVIRPLINVKREEILKYLESKGQDFVTDETNSDTKYLRNKIRHELIPYIKENYNKNLDNVIINTINSLKFDSEFIDEYTNNLFNRIVKRDNEISISLSELNNLPYSILSRVIIKSIRHFTDKTLSFESINNIISIIKNKRTGKTIGIDKKTVALIDYDKFIIKNKDIINQYCYYLNFGINYIKEIDTSFIIGREPVYGNDCIGIESIENLCVRTRKCGDKIYIDGIKGHKKIKDIFIDKKISRDKRDLWPLVTSDNKIIWLVGLYKNETGINNYYIKAERGNKNVQ